MCVADLNFSLWFAVLPFMVSMVSMWRVLPGFLPVFRWRVGSGPDHFCHGGSACERLQWGLHDFIELVCYPAQADLIGLDCGSDAGWFSVD